MLPIILDKVRSGLIETEFTPTLSLTLALKVTVCVEFAELLREIDVSLAEKEEIVADLIPKSLKIQLFKAVLDSHASEHGARMTAMHKATDNAGELKRELTLTYNKARQAAITGEILEIVGGAEALNS